MTCDFCLLTRKQYNTYHVGLSIYYKQKELIVDACFCATIQQYNIIMFSPFIRRLSSLTRIHTVLLCLVLDRQPLHTNLSPI